MSSCGSSCVLACVYGALSNQRHAAGRVTYNKREGSGVLLFAFYIQACILSVLINIH